ncbi:MAG: ADP/ATP-dependent (S)-NAD(P)H-hydrate dehydratase [Microbacteriaceae bacterium]
MIDVWTINEATEFLVEPTAESNKYSRGVVGFATGSVEFPGAAVLGVSAAMRTGVGMVRYIGPNSVSDLVLARRPETVTAHGGVNSWVVGSGQLDGHDPNELQREAYGSGVPVVLDAGAIKHATLTHSATIITPHIGELTRLLAANSYEISPSQVMADPLHYAKLAAERFSCTVVLKGNTTYIANHLGRALQVGPASPWLAAAGTGDVLAGILGAILATNYRMLADYPDKLIELAASGVAIHAEAAADLAIQGPILAQELADGVGAVVARALRV